MRETSINPTVRKMLQGDDSALARLITLAESGSHLIPGIMKSILGHTGKAHRIGITGPPGVGKSTLIDKIVAMVRQESSTVAILAVDPTSPLSGGAFLGDRIRMYRHYIDEGVFIRSMATRGAVGGLASAMHEVINLVDASGKNYVLVETVGVGQNELDIIKYTDTAVVVLAPDSGDSIQTMKAGLLEVADIFVINKSDMQGADRFIDELKTMLESKPGADSRHVPVVVTQANRNIGIAELYKEAQMHFRLLTETGSLAERRGKQGLQQFEYILERSVITQLKTALSNDKRLAGYCRRVISGAIDPYSAATEVLKSGILAALSSSGTVKKRPVKHK